MNFLYQSTLESAEENPNEATQVAIDEITEMKEKQNWSCKEAKCYLMRQAISKLK